MYNFKEMGEILFVGADFDRDTIESQIDCRFQLESTVDGAVEQIQHENITGVVSRLQLSDGDGIELTEVIRDDYSTLPVILWTNNGDEAAASEAITAGVTDYIIDENTNDRDFERVVAELSDHQESQKTGQTNLDKRSLGWKLTQYRGIVETVTDGICVLNQDSEFVEVNDAFVELTGYSRDQLIGAHASKIRSESLNETFDKLQADLNAGSRSETIELECQTANGDERVCEARYAQFSYDGVTGRIGVWRDITERKVQERELKAEKEKFRSLIEAAPDPIFVADAETGEVVEANGAACQIRKQPLEELIGSHQTDLHPEGAEDRHRKLFRRHVEEGGTISRFPDGSQVYLTDVDGERIPVAISTSTVDVGNRELIHGIFRDISDQKRHADKLRGLTRSARDFLKADTKYDIAETTIEAAQDLLDVTGVAIYLFDEETGTLVPVSYDASLESVVGELPTFSPDDCIAWRVYADQETAIFDDVRNDVDVYNPGTPIRSEIIVPMGEHGVLIAGDTEIGVFDNVTTELTEVLVSSANVALERVKWIRELREKEQEAQSYAERLERVNQINQKIRLIIRAIIQAESRKEIEQAVCHHLHELDRVSLAWIGEFNHANEEVTPTACVGQDQGYIESILLRIDTEEAEPALETIREEEPVVVENIAQTDSTTSWRQAALFHDLQAAISVPIIHDELRYGVLAMYGKEPGSFDDLSASVLGELGNLVGYAMNSVEQSNSQEGSSVVELKFELHEVDDAFVELASRLGGEINIRNISERSNGSYLVHLQISDIVAEEFFDVATKLKTVHNCRLIADSESMLIELVISGPSLVTAFANYNASTHAMVLSEGGARGTVRIPEYKTTSFIEEFQQIYPEATLVGRHNTERSDPSRLSYLLDQLTPRQQQILQAAYFSGFFEQPRKSTGSEIAEALGISQPAFSKQIRQSLRTLLQPLHEPG